MNTVSFGHTVKVIRKKLLLLQVIQILTQVSMNAAILAFCRNVVTCIVFWKLEQHFSNTAVDILVAYDKESGFLAYL